MHRQLRKKQFKKAIEQDLKKYGGEILTSPKFRGTFKNMQHGEVSVAKHCMKVAYASLWINRKFKFNCVEEEMVRGALLHDYFLYDWHDEEHCGIKNLHGFKHPKVALKNASADYELTPRESDIIAKHMWPMTVIPPLCREGWVVTLADKCISTAESVHFIQTRKRYIEMQKALDE